MNKIYIIMEDLFDFKNIIIEIKRDYIYNNVKHYLYTIYEKNLADFKRNININNYNETSVEELKEYGDYIYFEKLLNCKINITTPLLDKLNLYEKNEWTHIPDVNIIFPVEYNDISLINAYSSTLNIKDDKMEFFLNNINYRTIHEFNLINQQADSKGHIDIRSRLKRSYLGKILLFIKEEDTYENKYKIENIYSINDVNLSGNNVVDIFLSYDCLTSVGAITINSTFCPFLVSRLLDSTVADLLYVKLNDKEILFTTFIKSELGLFKRGTPKVFVNYYGDNRFSVQELGSLLLCDPITYSDVKNEYGNLIDKEVLDIVSDEKGLGQYDRARVYAYRNCLISFVQKEILDVFSRISDQSITFFYIELIVLEEAAIQISTNSMINLLNKQSKISTSRFFSTSKNIQSDYCDSMIYWDINLKYPLAKKSLNMIRESFDIDSIVKRHNIYNNEMNKLFELKRDISSRFESSMLNFIILVLTITQVLTILIPNFLVVESWDGRNDYGLLIVVIIILLYKIIIKSNEFINK